MLESIIKDRKSIRQFDARDISEEIIHKTIDIAKYAPSGKNRQPWKIKILSASDKETLIEILNNKIKNSKNTGSLKISVNAIQQSSKTLLFFNPYSCIEKPYSRNTLLMDTQSLGAFIQNILLLLTEQGIASLWINDIFFAKDEIEKAFSNGNIELTAAVAIGYSTIIKKYDARNDLFEILI